MTIANSIVNQSYYIVGLDGQVKDRRRLLDMGLTPNTFITVYKFAPFKSSVLISIRGNIIALRLDIAQNIRIRSVHN